MYTLEIIDRSTAGFVSTGRVISRHRSLEAASKRWESEYWGSDPGTYRSVEIFRDGERVQPESPNASR